MIKKQPEQKSKPELLAPAGSIETFHSGFQAGADAFYLGVEDFNARRRAKNFSLDELREVTLFAHGHAKRIYITLNTLVFDNEIPKLIDILSFLEEIRADGIIVQDTGIIYLVKKYFPNLHVHASTQMFCHNSQQALFLKNMGVNRIILPRELGIAEINRIMEEVPLEYEIFIHGAMCFSFSGCCLFSSYFFGDSGNRGKCRQPCRYPFKTDGNASIYPFSMRDLDTSGIIGKLMDLGVSAFKVEGRLKNADYVYRVISMYRELIDKYSDSPDSDSTSALTGHRETAQGYYSGGDYDKLIQKNSPGVFGEYAGEVFPLSGNMCLIRSNRKLQKGMRLRITDSTGRKIHEGTLLDFTTQKKFEYRWNTGTPVKSKKNLLLYLIGESAVFHGGKSIRYESRSVKYIPVKIEIKVVESQIRVASGFEKFPDIESIMPLKTAAAKKNAISEETVGNVFAQMDRYPFDPDIKINIQNGLFVPLSELKKIRREIYCNIYKEYRRLQMEYDAERKKRILQELKEIEEKNRIIGNLYFKYDNMDDGSPAEFIITELEDMSSGTCKDNVILLPLFVSEGMLEQTFQIIESLVSEGHKRFMLPAYGWLEFFKRWSDVLLFAGPMLYMVNSFAYDFLQKAGIKYFAVSMDMEREKIATTGYRGYIRLLSYRKDLMASRLRLPEKCYKFKDDMLNVRHYREYDVVRSHGR